MRVPGFDDREQLWFECAQSSFGDFVKRGGRDIGRWTTRDLKEWSKEELVLTIAEDESRTPQDWVEYMDIRVFRAAGLWLGQLVIFHGDRSTPQAEMPTQKGVWRKGTTELRLIMSRDAGKSWQCVGDKQIWVPFHEAEDGFDRLVLTGSPVRVHDELWLYYSCWDGDHLNWNRDGTTYYKDRARIGRTARAVLRWDGYVSLCPQHTVGEVLTKPMDVAGDTLQLNAAAQKGRIRVEVQDAEGRVIRGLSLRNCRPVHGDRIAQRVRWGPHSRLPEKLRGRPMRLRFEIKNAELYGFQLS
ncbi:MAG: hypothetical protein HY706_16640 [Candidatus Hydrogenedentes bacterium]|nr:hypothetical protein [Candidatus Hydrogenedentota bacterium]